MKNAVPPSGERRRFQRVPIVNIVWYKIIPEAVDDQIPGGEGICKSFDISKGGVGLHLTNPLPTGRGIFLEIKTRKSTISAFGKVVHSSGLGDGNHRAGIQFEAIPPNDALALSEELTA